MANQFIEMLMRFNAYFAKKERNLQNSCKDMTFYAQAMVSICGSSDQKLGIPGLQSSDENWRLVSTHRRGSSDNKPLTERSA